MGNHTVNCKKLAGMRHGFLPLIKGETQGGFCAFQPPPTPLLHKDGEFARRNPASLPGYTLAGALVLIAVMSILMAMALPVWDRIKQRENEEELIFRGKEYMEAIGRYHAKFNSYPPELETLYEMKFLRKLYKDPMTESGEWKVLHPDSLVELGDAGSINQPGSKNLEEQDLDPDEENKQEKRKDVIPGLRDPEKDQEKDEKSSEDDEEKSIGPVVGVVSRSKQNSLRIYNGQSTYDKWIFAYVPQQQQQQEQPQQPPNKVRTQPDKDGKKPTPKPKKPDGG
jgi:hypothetical protein